MQLYDLLKSMRWEYILFIFLIIKLKSFLKLNISIRSWISVRIINFLTLKSS